MIKIILIFTLFYSQGFAMDQLTECPNKPNCISSQSQSDYAKINPLDMKDNLENTKNNIIKIMQQLPKTKLIKNEGHYLHFTAKSKLIGFTDDVEFLIDEQNKIIHFKSASRLGYRDFGVNRERLEKIRSMW